MPIIIVKPVVSTSEREGVTWRYTTDAPPENWVAEDFDDSGWKSGPGGFGTKETPGAIVRTEWNTGEIWLRRDFTLGPGELPGNLQWRIHHDEDATVYLNGKKALSLSGYTQDYTHASLTPAAQESLREGKNVVAVHCRQTRGGQYIDVGLDQVIEKAPK
jgi:hypothetical protein